MSKSHSIISGCTLLAVTTLERKTRKTYLVSFHISQYAYGSSKSYYRLGYKPIVVISICRLQQQNGLRRRTKIVCDAVSRTKVVDESVPRMGRCVPSHFLQELVELFEIMPFMRWCGTEEFFPCFRLGQSSGSQTVKNFGAGFNCGD